MVGMRPQISTSTAKRIWRGPRLVAATSLGLAGVGAAVALVLGASATAPAFAVTRNNDGTVTISINRASGIAGANSRLRQLGIRAQVMQHAPAGFRCTSTVVQPEQGAPASERYIAKVHWTIDPRRVPAGRTLALTPPLHPLAATAATAATAGTAGTAAAVATVAPGVRCGGAAGPKGLPRAVGRPLRLRAAVVTQVTADPWLPDPSRGAPTGRAAAKEGQVGQSGTASQAIHEPL
jgi:hypothetical protein